MNINHIHIFGAPGSGVSTLGKSLAERLGFAHFDTDDFYWFTDDELPFRRKRNPDHRRKLLAAALDSSENWVLSGSLCGWGDVFIPKFDAAVLVWLPAEERLRRIRQREIGRFGGEDRLLSGGDLHLVFEKFLVWAADYDLPSGKVRTRVQELIWFEHLGCRKLVLTSGLSVELLVGQVLEFFQKA